MDISKCKLKLAMVKDIPSSAHKRVFSGQTAWIAWIELMLSNLVLQDRCF
jgi:pyruvate-formate lyase